MNCQETSNRRLLLVDDTPAIHEDYRKILAGDQASPELDDLMNSVFGDSAESLEETFQLTSAMQGQEALKIVEQSIADQLPFAAAFVDMRMPPGWDGLQTIERIWEVDPNIQVVICTAYADYSWDEIIQRVGCDGKLLILKKPFDSIEVRQLATTLCRKWELELAAKTENQELSDLSKRLSDLNAGLERSVAERTESLQLVLDSTGEGIFTVGLDGRILSERSRVVESWLGEIEGSPLLWEYLSGENRDQCEYFEMAFAQMVDDLLPFELTASQAPQRIQKNHQTFDLRYREIRDHDQLKSILIVVSDVSVQVEAERAAQSALELQTILGSLLQDADAFRSSIRELEQILTDIQSCDDVIVARRLIHTLKGNAAVLGFSVFARQIHCLESVLEDSHSLPSEDQIESLQVRWNEEISKLGPFSKFLDCDLMQIRKSEVDQLLEMLHRRAKYSELTRFAETWKLQPLSVPLKRLATQAKRIAHQLDKKLDTQIDDGGLSLPEERLAEFWPTMIHIIRNAVDHGLESAAKRRSLNKPERGRILLKAEVAHGWLEIHVSDDGRGVDWEKIRQKADKLGLPSSSKPDLIDALFSDGFSTKEVTTELSGRGVGLSTVRQAAERCGGGITVASTAGEGTSFVVRFPWEQSLLENRMQSQTESQNNASTSPVNSRR